MSKYANKQFWIDAADRAISTFAQGALGVLTFNEVVPSIVNLDLGFAAGVGLASALISLLQSVAFRGAPEES